MQHSVLLPFSVLRSALADIFVAQSDLEIYIWKEPPDTNIVLIQVEQRSRTKTLSTYSAKKKKKKNFYVSSQTEMAQIQAPCLYLDEVIARPTTNILVRV